MAKKLISIRISDDTAQLLSKLAESQSRSQGGQIEHLIKQEAEKLGIKVDKPA